MSAQEGQGQGLRATRDSEPQPLTSAMLLRLTFATKQECYPRPQYGGIMVPIRPLTQALAPDGPGNFTGGSFLSQCASWSNRRDLNLSSNVAPGFTIQEVCSSIWSPTLTSTEGRALGLHLCLAQPSTAMTCNPMCAEGAPPSIAQGVSVRMGAERYSDMTTSRIQNLFGHKDTRLEPSFSKTS